MRTMALLTAGLVLAAQMGLAAQEARPQPMTPAEDARLAARASHHPELEKFTAGDDVQTLEACLLIIVFLPLAAFSVAVGQLIAFPLGLTHSSQGRGFVPKDSLRGNPKPVNYLNVCGAIIGFHLYAIGYLVGLPFATEPRPTEKPAPPDGRDLERYFIGTTIDIDGFHRIVSASDAASRAGLEDGDLILDIEHVEVDHVNLALVMLVYTKGDSVEVGILREGCRLRMTVTKD